MFCNFVPTMAEQQKTAEEVMQELRALADRLVAAGRKDLLLKAIGVPLLEELRIEAAKSRLSRLVITKDYRFVLADYQVEVELQPVHKAVYLLFLNHPEGCGRAEEERRRAADHQQREAVRRVCRCGHFGEGGFPTGR